ncbi:MAG: TlpA family protein disulfide reductase [Burkholderiales bacterium]|nr:TlpA family protein disulfide reductase [Phycisphaerae bacterium]
MGITQTILRTGLPLVGVALLGLAIVHFTHRGPDDDVPLRAFINQPAPDFALPLIDGGTLKLSEHRGKVVVLDFWSVYCPPCIVGMPINEKIAERYAGQGVEMFAVNVGDSAGDIARLRESIRIKTPIATDTDTAVARAYQVVYFPQIVVIDRQGLLHAVATPLPEELENWLPAAIESALKSGEAAAK